MLALQYQMLFPGRKNVASNKHIYTVVQGYLILLMFVFLHWKSIYSKISQNIFILSPYEEIYCYCRFLKTNFEDKKISPFFR